MRLNNKNWSMIWKILVIITILLVNSAYINAKNSESNGNNDSNYSNDSNNNIGEGILPGSPFYKGEVIAEKLSLFLTFNPDAKAKKALAYGNERIIEANFMLNSNKFEEAEKAILENSALISEISKNIRQIRYENVETEAIEILKIEDNVEEYRFNLEGLKNEVQINGEVKWAEDISKIIEVNRKELKASLDGKKIKTMIKVKAVNGFNQSEAERYLKPLEEKYGLDEKEKKRIVKALSRAKDYLLRAKDRLEIAHDRGFNTDNLAERLYKIEKEIDNITITEEKYDDARSIARKAGDMAISTIAERDGRKFERELVERADKILSEIREIKKGR